jgi:hypothetical protein
MFRAAIDADPKLQVKNCWKSFTTANTITFIKSAMDELKPETVNAWCKNMWSEHISDFNIDMIDEETEEYIKEHQKVLTNEKSEGTEVEPEMWTLKKFGEMFRIAQT